jgi:hypothetical protein
MFPAYSVAGFGVAVALTHSMICEKQILAPLFEEESKVLEKEEIKKVTRGMFHLPSFVWASLGVAVLVNRNSEEGLIVPALASTVYGLSGIGNLICTKRIHPGGVLLLLAAACCIWDIKSH